MKRYLLILAALTLFPLGSATAVDPQPAARAAMKEAPASQAASGEYQQTLKDIKDTLGLVPVFFKTYPASALPGAWALFKGVQLNPNSAIPGKYKELIGVALAGQIPCTYCSRFHTTGARKQGASSAEIEEAVALGALARQWSTFISGSNIDEQKFRSETDQIMKKVRNDMQQPAGAGPEQVSMAEIQTPEQAYEDMERTLGLVPDFIRSFPKAGVVGAWKQTKPLLFSANAAIPPKYRDLISLAVSSQTSCPSCVYFDRAASRADGASEDEVNEAVAMASISRHWSVVLNGMQTDNAQFNRELEQIFKRPKK